MKNHENQGADLLIITFDDKKTSAEAIIGEIKKGKFKVVGEPLYVK